MTWFLNWVIKTRILNISAKRLLSLNFFFKGGLCTWNLESFLAPNGKPWSLDLNHHKSFDKVDLAKDERWEMTLGTFSTYNINLTTRKTQCHFIM